MRDRPRGRVVLVGRAAPERGGIPTFLHAVLASRVNDDVELCLLNLGRADMRAGGRASVGNVVRSGQDALRLWRAIRRGDVVHLNTAFAPAVTVLRAGLLVLVARCRRARVAVHVHGGLVERWMRSRPRRLLVRVALLGASRIIVVSTGARDALSAACGPRRISLMDNAVATDVFCGPVQRHQPPRVLFVGGLTPRKGVVDLMDASRRLDVRGVAHEIWLVGGTPDEGAAEERTVRGRAGPAARFLGPRPPEAMPDAYRSADVFCLPSWYEAMPLSVLEAMATGLPVVATRVGDIDRLVQHGVTGLLVPPKSPDELADALEAVLTCPDRAASMGAAGAEAARTRFAMPRLVDDLRALYTELGVHSP